MTNVPRRLVLLAPFTGLLLTVQSLSGADLRVGAARLDITPPGPIRLSGYAVRKSESEGVEQRLWAKAMAIGEGRRTPCLLITVDNVGVPGHVVEEVARRLKSKAGLPRENLVISSSHTHTGPCLTGALGNLFVAPIPPDQQATIDRYTIELTDQLEKVGLAALKDRRPAQLYWNEGRAG